MAHNYGFYSSTLSPYVDDTDVRIQQQEFTPDYRIEEPVWTASRPNFYREENRPYRISPSNLQLKRWDYNQGKQFNSDHPYLLGCYCTTVFSRVVPLAGCAVITTRHILTTASSTHLILKKYGKWKRLDNILGAWYDQSGNDLNSSVYAVPARIHYHPEWSRPEHVNISHPMAAAYDLAVWACTIPFISKFQATSYGYTIFRKAYICRRGGSGRHVYRSPVPQPNDLFIAVGFQFVWSYKKWPMPWYKYAVRTRKTIVPCPKTEWGWFICVSGRWAPLGFDNGGALHRAGQGDWTEDGLVGIASFSMKLRSFEMVHYFQPVNTHKVLDFLYDAYMGHLQYEFLDYRFEDTKNRAPLPKAGYYVPWVYTEPGSQPLINKFAFPYT